MDNTHQGAELRFEPGAFLFTGERLLCLIAKTLGDMLAWFGDLLYLCARYMRNAVPILILMLLLPSCEHISMMDDEGSMAEDDDVVSIPLNAEALNDTLFLAPVQYVGVLIEDVPCIQLDSTYRPMTRQEAAALRWRDIGSDTYERYLCRDTTGQWYTFRWNSGVVSKAGSTVRYTYRPVFVSKGDDVGAWGETVNIER